MDTKGAKGKAAIILKPDDYHIGNDIGLVIAATELLLHCSIKYGDGKLRKGLEYAFQTFLGKIVKVERVA